MSQPHEPGGAEHEPQPPQAGAQPSTESEPTPSAASTAEPPPEAQVPPMPPPPGVQAGHYVFVPAGARPPGQGFGPAFGRFVRNRATHLVAAVVVGALVGGGTVAIVDNAGHDRPQFSNPGPFGGPFRGGNDHRLPGFGFGDGGQRSGN